MESSWKLRLGQIDFCNFLYIPRYTALLNEGKL